MIAVRVGKKEESLTTTTRVVVVARRLRRRVDEATAMEIDTKAARRNTPAATTTRDATITTKMAADEDVPRPNNSEEEQAPCTSFDAMNLKPDLLKGIYAYGFEKPSAIQQRAIKPIVRGRDVIAQSQSGTGKTVRVYFFAFIVIVACILALMCHILPPLYSNISVVKIPFFRNYKLLTLNN